MLNNLYFVVMHLLYSFSKTIVHIDTWAIKTSSASVTMHLVTTPVTEGFRFYMISRHVFL